MSRITKYNQRVTVLGLTIFTLAIVFFAYEYLLRISPSVMSHQIMAEYHIGAVSFGYLSSLYYFAYTPMQIPVGLLIDKFGVRRLLLLACAACVSGAVLFSMTSFPLACIGRFAMGFGSAFAFVSSLKLISIWLPTKYFSLFSGLTVTAGMVGAISGEIILSGFVERLGWRDTILFSAFAGAVLFCLLFVFIKDSPVKNLRQKKKRQTIDYKRDLQGLKKLVANKIFWMNGLVGLTSFLASSAFAELWGIPYLEQVYQLPLDVASWAVSMVFIGWAIGGPLSGWLAVKFSAAKILAWTCLFAAIAFSLILYVSISANWLLFILLFIFGVLTASHVLVFTVARNIAPPKYVATAIAFTNTFMMASGIIFQPLIGYLLEMNWSGKLLHGIPVFSNANYMMSLSLIPLAYLIGAVIAFNMRKQ